VSQGDLEVDLGCTKETTKVAGLRRGWRELQSYNASDQQLTKLEGYSLEQTSAKNS